MVKRYKLDDTEIIFYLIVFNIYFIILVIYNISKY